MQTELQKFYESRDGQNLALTPSTGRDALVGRHFAATFEGQFARQWHRVLGRRVRFECRKCSMTRVAVEDLHFSLLSNPLKS